MRFRLEGGSFGFEDRPIGEAHKALGNLNQIVEGRSEIQIARWTLGLGRLVHT